MTEKISPVSVEKIEDPKYREAFSVAQDLDQLFTALDNLGSVEGSGNRIYQAGDLKERINQARELVETASGRGLGFSIHSPIFSAITNTGGLRQKAFELISKKLAVEQAA